MEFIRCETDSGLAVITMVRGTANALNSAMIDELLHAVAGERHALEHFIDHWFSPQAEERKQALIASMQR